MAARSPYRPPLGPNDPEPPLHDRHSGTGRHVFARGHKKHGGIKKGTKRLTGTTKEMIRAFVDENWAEAQAIYERVKKHSPVKAIDLLIKATEYTEPKLARTEQTGPGGGPIVVELVTLGGSGQEPTPPKQEAMVIKPPPKE